MRIGIDARFFGPTSKGLGLYTQNLVEELEKIDCDNEGDSDNEYVIFLRKDNFDTYQPQNKNFRKVCADYAWYSFAEQLYFPGALRKEHCDFIHFPHFNVPLLYRRKFIVTIHDLILVHFPTLRATTLNPLFYWIKFLAYKIVIRSAIMRADKVLAVSNFTRDDVLAHYPLDAEKIVTTHEAGFERDDVPRPEAPKTLERHDIIEPYLLYVGNAYPHKNLERLVLAFAVLQQKNKEVHLVLVGKNDYFYQQLQEYVNAHHVPHVHIVHGVTNAELRDLYARAHAYVFPSLYEGFGIPPLEAFAYGVPTTTTDHPCMKEICGDAVLYFDGKDHTSITAAMARMLDDEALREQLRVRGYERMKKFSWKKMARETHDIYQQQ